MIILLNHLHYKSLHCSPTPAASLPIFAVDLTEENQGNVRKLAAGRIINPLLQALQGTEYSQTRNSIACSAWVSLLLDCLLNMEAWHFLIHCYQALIVSFCLSFYFWLCSPNIVLCHDNCSLSL